MGANADPTLFRRRDCLAHDQRVPGMEAAGNIGAGDDVEQGLVVTHGPSTEALAQIRIEIDGFAHDHIPLIKDTNRAARALPKPADRR